MAEELKFTDIIDFIDKYWDSFKLGIEKPKEFAITGVNIRRSGPHATRCFKVLNKSDLSPVLIIKMPQMPGSLLAYISLSTEYNIIKKLHSNDSLSSIIQTIPKAIELTKIKGVQILLEKAFTGNNLELLIGADPEDKIANIIFYSTLAWLSKLHLETQEEKFVFNEKSINSCFKKPFEEIEKKYGQSLHDTYQYIYTQLKRLSIFNGLELNLSLTHGDFNPWNIILQKDESICVVDWEDTEFNGLFLRDLFYFVLVYTWELFYNAKAKEKYKNQGEDYFENKASWYTKLVKDNISSFFSQINLPLDSIDLFFLIFLVKNTEIDLENKRSINKTSAKRWLDILNLKFEKDIFFNYIAHSIKTSILL